MQTPKYKIGDTVFIGFTTFEAPLCEKCHQRVYDEENREEFWIPGVNEQTIEGISINKSIREVDDGVFYQLSGGYGTTPESAVHSTREAALESARKSVY